MADTLEERRKKLTAMRKEIGDRIIVGNLIERSYRSISSYESKGGPLPAWYEIVIVELHRRKKRGLPLAPKL